jgi:rhodanese-related sulfurtransferase
MKRLVLALALIATAAAALWLWRGRATGLGAVEATVRAQFPDVPTISTDSLARALASGDAPLLLDAREPAEYAVSHLPGAVRVDPSARGPALDSVLAALPPGREVVVYCSVGYRSAALAERLREAGAGRVANLEGSIFRWANEGRPLAGAGAARGWVHPYSETWGRLLDPERRAPLAE